MKLQVGFVTLLTAFILVSHGQAAPVVASMEGTVEIMTTPTLRELKTRGDSFCTDCAGGNTIPDDSLIVNRNGTVKGAIVYIKSQLPAEVKARPTTGTLQMSTECCRFNPRVLAARTGQKLIVQNKDNTLHNFNTRSDNNPRTNALLRKPGEKSEVVRVFEKTDLPVKIRCDIHPWMVAFVGVFDHPYFAVTDDKGNFRFENLPPGEYTVGLWHEVLGEHEQEVTLGGGGVPSKVEFRLNPGKFR